MDHQHVGDLVDDIQGDALPQDVLLAGDVKEVDPVVLRAGDVRVVKLCDYKCNQCDFYVIFNVLFILE